MFDRLLKKFQGLKVIEFDKMPDWKGPKYAYRLREEYDEPPTVNQRLAELVDCTGCDKLPVLIIGAWEHGNEKHGAPDIVADLVQVAPRLPGLRHLFFGEMEYRECEISWIVQTDLSPLLQAFPALESLRVRGGEDLAFSQTRHNNLRELAIETGGLSRSTIRDIFQCDFPALEHLELFLGDDAYGFDGSVEDLQPLLSGRLFPNLKYLGLMNSCIVNEIAPVVVNAPVMSRIETLDLSLGNLNDEGIRGLAGLAACPQLKKLILSHHYVSKSEIKALKKVLRCKVIADDHQELEDEEWSPIAHAE